MNPFKENTKIPRTVRLISCLFTIFSLFILKSCSFMDFIPDKYTLPNTAYVNEKLAQQEKIIKNQEKTLQSVRKELDSLQVESSLNIAYLNNEITILQSSLDSLNKVLAKKDSFITKTSVKLDTLQQSLQELKEQSVRIMRLLIPSQGNEKTTDSLIKYPDTLNISRQMEMNRFLGEILRVDKRIDTVYQDLHIVEDSFMGLLKLGQEQSMNNLAEIRQKIREDFSLKMDTLLFAIDTLKTTQDSLSSLMEKFDSLRTVQNAKIEVLDSNLVSYIREIQAMEIRISGKLKNLENRITEMPQSTISTLMKIMEGYLDSTDLKESSDSLNAPSLMDTSKIHKE